MEIKEIKVDHDQTTYWFHDSHILVFNTMTGDVNFGKLGKIRLVDHKPNWMSIDPVELADIVTKTAHAYAMTQAMLERSDYN